MKLPSGAEGRGLVPPTSGDQDVTKPLNPTDSLAVFVPILVDGRSEGVLQVLMPIGGGLATQRGYLRFAAQMGDLAGEFLRAETLRRFKSETAAWTQLAQSVGQLHGSSCLDEAAILIVDEAANVFDIDRVSFLRRSRSSWRVLAISGVPDFDERSPTVKALCKYVDRRTSLGAVSWIVEAVSDEQDVCYRLSGF
ncbi:MAG: hypothetical protein R3C05_23705 [Pirellulaceae bacterium]